VAVVIFSRNEADLLRSSLPAATGYDELIVCDMQSSDDTVDVARAAGARVVDVPDARVIEDVRQLGLDAVQSDWVLFVDADEILPTDFADHVRSLITTADAEGIVAYRLRYANVAFGRTLRHTLVGSAKYSLMRRVATRFPSPGRAHIPPEFDGPQRDAPPSVPPILHLNFRTASQMTEKTLRYAADAEGDLALLRPLGLLRELLRAIVFSGSWQDGYAGTAVTTSAVMGRWYAALLAAERRQMLGAPLPAAERRALGALRRAHQAVMRARRRGGELAGRLRGLPPRSSKRP
jgi:hypothetical protein